MCSIGERALYEESLKAHLARTTLCPQERYPTVKLTAEHRCKQASVSSLPMIMWLSKPNFWLQQLSQRIRMLHSSLLRPGAWLQRTRSSARHGLAAGLTRWQGAVRRRMQSWRPSLQGFCVSCGWQRSRNTVKSG